MCSGGSATVTRTAWAERVTARRAKSTAAVVGARDPLGPRGSARAAGRGRRLAAPGTRRCTSTSPSRSPRTRSAWRRTASPRPSCSPTHGVLGPRTSAVHATHLTDTDIALLGGSGDVRLLLPDHRARPRRRHRPRPTAARGGQPADPGQRQPRGDRPVRGDARGRARRAAGHPASAVTGPPPSCSPPRPATDTPASASPTPAGSRSGQRADLVTIDTASRPHRGHRRATRETAVFAATAEDVVQVMVDGRLARHPR